MRKPRGIIVLDGADATGKTTLANHFREAYGAKYLHLRVHSKMWKWHLAAVDRAARLADDHLVVIDRLWLSEQAYGQTFRGGPAYDLGARCLDRVLQRYGALNVVCVRRNLTEHLAEFEKLKTTRPEKFDAIRDVAVLYYDLVHGNVGHAGDTYLDQLIRWGDYTKRTDVAAYDLDLMRNVPGRLDRVANQLLANLRMYRDWSGCDELTYANQNVVGSPARAKYLFVGEAVTPNHGSRLPLWPFVSDDRLNSATWLNRALHAIKFDETAALWTNAESPDPQLKRLLDQYPGLRIITFGLVAAAAVHQTGRKAYRALRHPQWERRFNQHNLIGYAQRIQEALQ